MNLLTFDIECANTDNGKAKICSFGYVLTDENFCVLKKQDLIVNPKAQFHSAMSRLGDVNLAYTKEEFRDAPTFDLVYPEIKRLLEAPDQLVVGHSINNDIGYLRDDCLRYNLIPPAYRFIDAQVIQLAFDNAKHPMALDKIAAAYGITFTAHKSDDDAYATMLYLGAICRRAEKSLAELLREYSVIPGSADADGYRAMACEKAVRRDRELERLRALLEHNHPDGFGALDGRKICFNLDLERRDPKTSSALIKLVNHAGGKVVAHARECDTFIYDYEHPCDRCRSAKNKQRQGKDIDFWKEDELLRALDLPALSALPPR